MTTMPTIDDRMVVLLRRTGKRRAAYAADRRGGLAGRSARVVPQSCIEGQPCITAHGGLGRCFHGKCLLDFPDF